MVKHLQFSVSSTAFRKIKLSEAIRVCNERDWVLEFASGLPYAADMKDVFFSATCKKLIHNYFPAPLEPFVLNLASMNPEVLKKSIAHVTQGLEFAAAVKCPFYSVHAGFCMDPDPNDLGKPFDLKMIYPRERHWETFLNSVDQLLKVASSLGVKLVIENNVLAKFNLTSKGENPTLCAGPEEILKLIELFGNRDSFGLLLDTAHLKVSRNTIGFNVEPLLTKIAPYTHQIHHSDNDGSADTNGPIDKNYWFLEHMGKFSHAVHTLEVHDQSEADIAVQKNILAGAYSDKNLS